MLDLYRRGGTAACAALQRTPGFVARVYCLGGVAEITIDRLLDGVTKKGEFSPGQRIE
jgi:hypothetical protein